MYEIINIGLTDEQNLAITEGTGKLAQLLRAETKTILEVLEDWEGEVFTKRKGSLERTVEIVMIEGKALQNNKGIRFHLPSYRNFPTLTMDLITSQALRWSGRNKIPNKMTP